uniref:Uncharacterized protein n=1 Tax=Vespula pensylvanica TaxID=30213 RepID=A0A834UEZ7_VESPE|nr:hypothetical protein H0235_003454 [Vespula pensylvanica]
MAGLGGAIREGRRGSIKWDPLSTIETRISIVAIGRAKIPELPCTIDKWIPLVESRQDRSSSPIELAPRLSGDSSKSQTLRSGNQIAVEYADNS